MWNILVSSENIFTVLRIMSGRAFIKMTNNIGPKTAKGDST